MQLATNGGSGDPRSTNQSLGDGLNRKGIGLDLAYADWKPVNGLGCAVRQDALSVAARRQLPVGSGHHLGGRLGARQPRLLFRERHGLVAVGIGFGDGGTLFGTQLGWKHDYGAVKFLGAVNYIDVGGLQGEVTNAATGCVVNAAFFGGAQGNTTFTDGLGCTRLMDDYNLVEALAQADFKVGGRIPVVVFGDYLRNQRASDHDTGYSLGFGVGKAADPHSWEFGYAWQSLEKDAQFGQFTDSDFGGGITDTRGSVFKFGYAPAKSWTVNATYFLNQRFVNVGTKSDYDRWQLDLNYKF